MAKFRIIELLKGFLKIVLMVIGSWFLVHFFALLGFFVSIAHIILWFFFPKSTICVSCMSKKEGEYCKSCNKVKEKQDGTYAKTLRSAWKTSLYIIMVSIVSVGLVYVESKVLQSFVTPTSEKTVSFVIPTEAQYMKGEIFGMEIKLSGIETPINAIQADLGFDKERLEVVDISTKGSFASVFLQNEYNNDLGYARLSGGLPNPGFNGPEGLFGTVYFKSKVPGLAQVFFLETSLVLANDGDGTNVIKEYSTISYLITPEEVPLDTQQLQQSLLLNEVLGAQDEQEEQILLFEEEDENVLGVQDALEGEVKGLGDIQEDDTLLLKLLHILEAFDTFILNILENIFTFFDSQISNILNSVNE